MAKLKETNIQQYEHVRWHLQTAVETIRDYCKSRGSKFDFDTPIPYGIGVDPSLLTAETLFKARKPGIEPNFLEVNTIGDIFKKMEWTLHQFFS